MSNPYRTLTIVEKGPEELLLLLLLFFLLVKCGPNNQCYRNGFTNITWYDISPDIALESGIRVDSGGWEIDTKKLDERLTSIDKCLIDTAKEFGYIDVLSGLKTECIVIKVVDPVEGCSEQQFIDVLAPEKLCKAKGVEPTPNCPCRWRTALQDDNVVITPPSIYLWEVVRMHTGLDLIWDTPFVKCAAL